MKKPPRIHKSGFKVSPEQREELVRVYLECGLKKSAEMCRALGMAPKYAANLASIMGLHRHKNDGLSTRTSADPRWQRAKEIGPVIA